MLANRLQTGSMARRRELLGKGEMERVLIQEGESACGSSIVTREERLDKKRGRGRK